MWGQQMGNYSQLSTIAQYAGQGAGLYSGWAMASADPFAPYGRTVHTFRGKDISTPEGKAEYEKYLAERAEAREAERIMQRRYYAKLKGAERREKQRGFMANTRAGYRAKRRAEIFFWTITIVGGFFGIAVPVSIKVYGWFWGWALS